jgi:hypothetical protein
MSLSPPETPLDHCPLAFVLGASVLPPLPLHVGRTSAPAARCGRAAIARGAAIDSLAPATGASLVGLPVDGMGWRMVGRRKPGVDWPLLVTGVAVTLALIAYATFHLAGVRFF